MISQTLIEKLPRAESVVVFTGAGISAESGVPTFRGEDGIWKKFNPQELADFNAFIRNPELVWEWYKYRKKIISSVKPNPGHYAIAEMERRHKAFTVITQNIDNLHRRAGSRNVLELHGNIERNYCIGCRKVYPDQEIMEGKGVPRCTACGELIRPDVVWFGEMLPQDAWNASVQAAEGAGVFFSVGTSAIVYPAASLPVLAKKAGSYVVEINIDYTEMSSSASEVVLGKSGEVLPRILEECYGGRGAVV